MPAETNAFLDALDPADLQMLDEPHLRPVVLKAGTVLYEPGARIDYVYFPHSGMISVLAQMASGHAVQTAMIGREGIVCSAVIGTRHAFDEAVVQIPGTASRVSAETFLAAYERSPTIRTRVTRYNTMMWAQCQQAAACNARHDVKARLCRSLLRARDIVGSDEIVLTQELLSQMIGVQRTSVTLVEGQLEEQGLIAIRRGRVALLDVEGLRRRACECYSVIKERAEQMGFG